MNHECIRAPHFKHSGTDGVEPIGAVSVMCYLRQGRDMSRPPPSVCYHLLVEERIVLVVNALLFEEFTFVSTMVRPLAGGIITPVDGFLQIEVHFLRNGLDIYCFHILYCLMVLFDVLWSYLTIILTLFTTYTPAGRLMVLLSPAFIVTLLYEVPLRERLFTVWSLSEVNWM